jgi:histidinol phosphatase-like PHP family hydrolase
MDTMKQKLIDFHTHNGESRCVKQPYSLEAGWDSAQKQGIYSFGVTNHVHYNSPLQDFLPDLRLKVDKINQSIMKKRTGIYNKNEVPILLGVELDVDSPEGICTLKPETFKIIDYVIGGPHNQPTAFLKMPDISEEEEADYFDNLKQVLTSAMKKVPLNIWVHPFLQEIENFVDKFWKKYMESILLECLPIIANKGIAIEITGEFHNKSLGLDDWDMMMEGIPKYKRMLDMLTSIYKHALQFPEIRFSFGSDAHSVESVGDIANQRVFAKILGIPNNRIVDSISYFKRN